MNSYIEENKTRFLEELFDWLRIPSISAKSEHKADMIKAAEYAREALMQAGADQAEVCQTPGHPIVYGEKLVDPTLPTVLVYGHYDVQPADPLELWHTPPFEPQVRDGKIYARGACDDKGQVYMHIKALETMVKSDSLSCNIKFMIEGEEEVGSDNLAIFVKDNKEKLKADIILISDTSIIDNDNPSITTGLRGIAYVEVEVSGPNKDLHSGVYGGAVDNPANVLCEMVARLKDKDGKITIPGFYDKVVVLSQQERSELAKRPFSLDEYKKELGLQAVHGEKDYSTIERVGIRPSLDVNGMWSGYIGEGAKTVLPDKAFAKISMRLVPNQDSDEIAELFTRYFHSLAPATVKVSVKKHHGGQPVVTNINSTAFRAASAAFEEAWGKPAIPTREGGSIPIVALFRQELGLDSVLMGFGLDSDAIHSPNEHYGVFNFVKGIETITLFHKYYGKGKRS
ncbi:MAG: dipeptidase [Cyclobacteriaceae bacterium]|nr:dipeptidase [Cyclobacteriaceae bacterium]